ncbi:patatin-like phospholipase family protein [Hyphococcus flavus]|uniref:Patatin-like phospholipase family protein n=1 Tax=Hyphococcus flavus TaxID=1866326 RepID=A0AAE9ZBV1_9PROT|nr:patatin-like phospholipase family protein [Hyphococcus flavus]WDI30500.1 patatin-like phospholipase family protein [Hyphococcus flavus]
MDTIRAHLRDLPFFAQLDEATIDAVADVSIWQSIAGGWELFSQGSDSEALHFNLFGRLIVVRKSRDDDEGEEVVGYVRGGEPVGEMSILSGEPHSASVYALRDTELLSIPRKDVERLIQKHGAFAAALARIVLDRTRHPQASFQQAAPRIFALIATSPAVDPNALAKKLADKIASYKLNVTWFPAGETAPESKEFDLTEKAHDVVLLAAKIDHSPWYRFVQRHADRFLVLARRDARPSKPFPLTLEAGARARKFRLVDLIMLHEGAYSGATGEWIDAIGASRVINCRGGACYDRLARIIAGKSIGLVLSGGGARAYAHIGAIKAMREKGVPIDFVCGASMGAVVAACVAIGWPQEEMENRIREAFVASNPLGDHVLPVVALTKGERVETRLEKHFDDIKIEDLSVPYFCVSSDVVDGSARIHRTGKLRDALRASIALPGILPPVVDDNSLLVDGAVVNNFPTDIMTGSHRGLTIGVDVAREGVINVDDFRNPSGFFSWMMEHGWSEAPPIVSLLMRAATARRERFDPPRPADIMIAPQAPGVELRDWKKFEAAVSDGYEAAQKAIEAHWDTLEPIVGAP